MADNVTLNSGTGGETLATDQAAGGEHYQKVKLVDGTADSTAAIPGDATNGLLVNLGANNDVTVSGVSTAANQSTANTALSAIQTAVEIIDNAISGTEMQADVLSVIPGTGATSLGKAIDGASGATDTGIAALAIRDDSLTTLTPIDGDYVPLRVNSTGALHVTGGGGGTEYNEDDATPATITGTATMMERDDALSALTPIEGDWASMRCDANGALWTVVNGTVTVDGSAVTQPVSGTVTANLSATDNAVLDQIDANTDYGAVVGGGAEATALRVTIANDSTGVVSIDDNAGSITVDNGGTFAVQAAQSGTWNVNNVSGTVSLPTGASTAANQSTEITALQIIDNPIVAHDAAASGSTGVNMAGAYGTNSVEGVTQVANADATNVKADLNGVLLSRPHTTLEEIISERVSDTAGTSTNFTNFAAGGAGIHNYVTTISIYNSSATDGYVDFRDGSAGSIIFTCAAPAAGGSVVTFPVPLKGAANTALAYDVSGALSTVYISVVGFQAQG